DAGIAFVPTSGRQYANLRHLFGQFLNRMSFVAENGTIAFMDDQPMFRTEMDHELGNEILQVIFERPGYEALVSGTTSSYIQPKNPAFASMLRDNIKYSVTIVDDMIATGIPYSKISAYNVDVRRDEAYWMERFGERCTIAVSGVTWLDFMPKGVSKASGLQAVCQQLGIDPADCIALGDNDNDVQMLDLVGTSIVMASGSARAKEHADRITPTANDAFRAILADLS
ncbi:MAG: HAD family hydrolase, partial [Coriobacteriia bacterium]|nr:HAD family hydrolase [Coriobacteriia bacterium]